MQNGRPAIGVMRAHKEVSFSAEDTTAAKGDIRLDLQKTSLKQQSGAILNARIRDNKIIYLYSISGPHKSIRQNRNLPWPAQDIRETWAPDRPML